MLNDISLLLITLALLAKLLHYFPAVFWTLMVKVSNTRSSPAVLAKVCRACWYMFWSLDYWKAH